MTQLGEDVKARQLTWLVVLLTLTTGATDVATFMRLGQVFASVMTGNLVLLGLGIGRSISGLAQHAGIAIGGYVVGAALGTAVTHWGRTYGLSSSRRTALSLSLELALLGAFTGGWEVTGGRPAGADVLVLLALATVGMGIQSATVMRLGVPGLSTTYLTGTLTSVVSSVVTRTFEPGFARSAAVLAAIAFGAGVGAALVASAPAAAPIVWLGGLASATVAAIVWEGREASSTQ